MGGFRAQVAADQSIAGLARRQHGVVSARQLHAAGITARMVERRTQAGRLHRIHHGVYAVGHAMLSHRSAAELWELLPVRAGVVDVTVPGRNGRRRRPGLRIHRPSSLPGSASTTRRRIAVTTPARTIADLRRVATPAEIRRATRQAEFLGLALEGIETDRTRSDLERDFLSLCRRHSLPMPEVNVKIGPYTIDFLWRERRLAVETDGWHAHRGRQAFLDDRDREAFLRMRGIDIQRFSDEQIANNARTVVELLRRRLT